MRASKELSAGQSTTPQEFYTWTFPGAPVRIHLYLNAVERLSHEVKRAFESVPSHSVEIGGLLLGTSDFQTSPIIEIKDFEPFLCEYRPDHKFLLSDPDRRKLERTLAAHRNGREDGLSVVGYYRSHIAGGMSLSEDDVAVAKAHFCDPASVFLVIKPSADGIANAGFFFWDNGRLDSEFTYLEFPFDARLLTGVRVTPTAAIAPAPSAAVNSHREDTEAAPATEPEWEDEEPGARSGRSRVWFRRLKYPAYAILLLGIAFSGYEAYTRWYSRPAAVVSDSPALALQVERHGGDLRVSWNKNTPVVTQAKEAVLSIRDGEAQQQELHLEIDQLRTGSVLYTPANANVQFRIEVTGPDGQKTTETVLALTAQGAGTRANSAPQEPAVRHEPPQTPLGKQSAAVPFSAIERKVFTPPAPATGFGEPVHVVLVDPPATPVSEAAQNPEILGAPSLPQPRMSLPQQPASQTPPTPDRTAALPYMAPKPVHQVQPILPSGARSAVKSEVEVQIKVEIDAFGRVVKAEPLPVTEPVSGFLVSAARNAALLWRFEPARRGDQAVASQLILKFQYRPADR